MRCTALLRGWTACLAVAGVTAASGCAPEVPERFAEVSMVPGTTETLPVVKDTSAACVDSDLPNVTVDDSVAYWEIVFDDQRRRYPDQSFPTPDEIEQQKRDEWSAAVDGKVPPGGDAAFAQDVCGLAILDGALNTGTPLREVRSHAANFGRSACSSVLDQGTTALRESAGPGPQTAAAQRYLLDSALTHVCPHLAEFATPPNAIPRCTVIAPDPSARQDEAVFCN